MEKVKNVFGKIGAWIKANAKIVIGIVVALVVVIILASIFFGGSEKRAVKKYFSAINSCDYSKVAKAMDLDAAVAWKNAQSSSSSYYSYSDSSKSNKDVVKEFEDNLEDVDNDDADSYKDNLKDSYDKDFYRCCNELCLSPQSRAKIANVNLNTRNAEEDAVIKALRGE